MRRRVSSRTGAESLTTRETVATETPARRATSLIVTAAAVLFLRDRRIADRGGDSFLMRTLGDAVQTFDACVNVYIGLLDPNAKAVKEPGRATEDEGRRTRDVRGAFPAFDVL